MEIYFDDRSDKAVSAELTDKMQSVIKTGLERDKISGNVEVSVSFVTPAEIRELNRDYRDKDAVTDVLSFPSGESLMHGDMSSGGSSGASARNKPKDFPVLLGDIVICAERAEEQAAEYGHGFEREMCFLTAHGLLHLLGYDHEDEAGEAAMIAEQEAILNALNITR